MKSSVAHRYSTASKNALTTDRIRIYPGHHKRAEGLLREALVGLPFTDLWRPGSQMFEFGEQKTFLNRQGEEALRADRSIRIFTDWRIAEGSEVVFGSPNHATKRRFYHRQRAPKEPLPRQAWERANRFFERVEARELRVTSVVVDPTLNLKITLVDDYAIESFRLSPFDDWLWWYEDDRSGARIDAQTLGEDEPGGGPHRC